MRTLLILLVLPALLAAQCFDVIQLVTPEAGAGVAAIPGVRAMLRLRAEPPVDDPDDNLSWRAAIVKESGEMHGALSLRIEAAASGFICKVRSGRGRRRYGNNDDELDPKGFTLVTCGWSHPDKLADVLVFRRVSEDAPFEQPGLRELLHELSSELLPAKLSSGVFGGIVAKVRGALSGANVVDRSVENWLAHLPLARLLEPERVSVLLSTLNSAAPGTTPALAALLRCALSDVTAIELVDPEHSDEWYTARAALRAGWAGSDVPAVRGAFALASSVAGNNSVPNWEEGSVLYEELRSGRATLPGTEEEQRRTLAQLEALARAANAGPALTLWAAAVVGIAALLWGTRKYLDRLLAS